MLLIGSQSLLVSRVTDVDVHRRDDQRSFYILHCALEKSNVSDQLEFQHGLQHSPSVTISAVNERSTSCSEASKPALNYTYSFKWNV